MSSSTTLGATPFNWQPFDSESNATPQSPPPEQQQQQQQTDNEGLFPPYDPSINNLQVLTVYAVATSGLGISQRGNHWSLHFLCYDYTAASSDNSWTSSSEPEAYDLRHHKTVIIEAIPDSAWMYTSHHEGDTRSRVSIRYFSRGSVCGSDTNSNNTDGSIRPHTHDTLHSFKLDLHSRYDFPSGSSFSHSDQEEILTVGDIIHCMAVTASRGGTANLTNYPFTTSRSSRDWAWRLLCELGRNKHLHVDQEPWDIVFNALWTHWPDNKIYTDCPAPEAGDPGPEWQPRWVWR